MQYKYKVFNLICSSSLPLPSFIAVEEDVKPDFEVVLGSVGPDFKLEPTVKNPFTHFNENEFFYQIPDIARYFVSNGNKVIIEPLCEDWDSILLFFYSNCVAAILFQRNLMPFHVSGVLDKNKGLWLFAAPSRTGKSTTALKLKEKGYTLFTDDTALISIENNSCVATASYPVLRAWQNTLDNQHVYTYSDAKQLRAEINKFGIAFHDDFVCTSQKVRGIVFLEIQGDCIHIEKMKAIDGMKLLGDNIYRNRWVEGMNKNFLQFKTISAIAQKVPFWKALRPKDKLSFESFADAIIEQIIEVDGK
ncbi:MAG: hypothetical protein K2Y30_11295 [Flavobacteriaceae bacterium]|uniref:HPr kinase n=1 Tax=Flavobacterium kayseriense TaxID=2764714 RepID=A0ABR7J4S7_9FLAO|nr:hypothetical protein [Flavobacterium kayseriense]MBC5840529.1 hypothetical protein [Flavobacterium kayseriense]MBC5846801.1 hypothetical protein [Flavobacterium kayseriense]MBU0942793.1 hypothetical protein [Bacteroidota bacterium]MBX9888506.1 hypothetical protein [Flavobacteriaceae bacterium]